MNAKKIEKFYDIQGIFQCPLCHEPMFFENNSIVCGNHHCFDISKKGYINFIPQQKELKGYDKTFFENRHEIFNLGIYDHILYGINQILLEKQEAEYVVDAGCGEGYYAKNLKGVNKIIGLDISKEAIKISANGNNDIYWLVADITNLPIRSNSIDCLLNIFTPANYSEFLRIMKGDGIIIKAIPGNSHLIELRQAVKQHIHQEAYSNQDVMDHFKEYFKIVNHLHLSRTFPITAEQAMKLYQMTPLLFNVEKSNLDTCSISHITIEAEILVGKRI